jgi:hypothetical protein
MGARSAQHLAAVKPSLGYLIKSLNLLSLAPSLAG